MNVDVVASGLRFGEGPRWHHGKLWFSDMYDHQVKAVDLSGRLEVKVDVPGQPSGLGWTAGGDLLIVLMRERQVLRLDHDRLVVHADLGEVATWHCNDMVVDEVGRAYVGNFGFDLHQAEASGDWSGIRSAAIALVQPDGSVSVAADDLHFPNGTVITPDGRTLIVAESLGTRLTAFTVADDGSLHDRRVWADLGFRVPDGICLDAEGNVWVANPLAPECMLVAESAEGGDVLDVIETDNPCFACMLGGEDRRTLFMLTATSSVVAVASASATGHLLSATVEVPGAGLP